MPSKLKYIQIIKKIIWFILIFIFLYIIINMVMTSISHNNHVCWLIGDEQEYLKKLSTVEDNVTMIRYLSIYNEKCKKYSKFDENKLDIIHQKLMNKWEISNDLKQVIGVYYYTTHVTKDKNKSKILLERARELGWDQ